MAKCLPVLLAQDLCTRCLPCLVHSASPSCSANTFLVCTPLSKLLSVASLHTQCLPAEFLDIFAAHLCPHPPPPRGCEWARSPYGEPLCG